MSLLCPEMKAMAKMANRQRVVENLNEIRKGATCKVANLTISSWQKSNLVKICHEFVEYSNWIPTAAPWRVATSTKNEESSNWRK